MTEGFQKPKSVATCLTLNEGFKIDFPANSLDLVTCYMSLHHFSRNELPLVLREINRVLKHSGYLFIREIDRDSGDKCPCHDEILEAEKDR